MSFRQNKDELVVAHALCAAGLWLGSASPFFWRLWSGESCHNCFASARVYGLCNDDDDGTCCQCHLVIRGTLLAVRRFGIPAKLSVRRNGEGCSSVWRVIASSALVKSGLTRGLPQYPTSATTGVKGRVGGPPWFHSVCRGRSCAVLRVGATRGSLSCALLSNRNLGGCFTTSPQWPLAFTAAHRGYSSAGGQMTVLAIPSSKPQGP